MNYEQLAETRFKSLDRTKLREACKTLGVGIGPNESEESMRKKLCANFGVAWDESEAPKLKPVKTRGVPNLSPNGAWEGKWWFVTIKTTEKSIISCPVGWQGAYLNLPLNKEIRIPSPHYRALCAAIDVENATYQIKVEEEDGKGNKTHRFETYTKSEPTYVISNARLDPATADCFDSFKEFFTDLAGKTDNFAKYNRKQLKYVFTTLIDYVRADVIEKMDDEDMRARILQKLGLATEDEVLGLEAA